MIRFICLIALFISPVEMMAQTANRYQVVIDEIMADPTPQVGLPNSEWIELKNTSYTPFNLQGWKIGDGTTFSGPMPSFILQPDSFVIVSAASSLSLLSAFGKAISVSSFPSLNNDGDQLVLQSAQNKIIHAIAYSSSWYQNELKKEGGWTLEMIDTKNPCSGINNWKASTDIKGGTPGKMNSVNKINPDIDAPTLLNTYSIDSLTLVAVFNEPLDSISSAAINNYMLDNGLTVISAIPVSPFFKKVQLKLEKKMESGKTYTLTVMHVSDCQGNIIARANTARTGIPRETAKQDIIINEILFNPRANANDYVEIYNRSTIIADASKMFIANRNSSSFISSIKQISATPFYIFPGDYIVITTDLASLQLNYLVKNPKNVLTILSMPTFPDDKGFVVLLNGQGEVVDEVNYNKNWHFKLIDNDEGVSLERINPDGPSQDATNWHSAASTAGFGTPTYQNSQYHKTGEAAGTIAVTPAIFSPDNDGRDDVAIIQYKVNEPGFVANIMIYDAGGRQVKNLVKNGSMGISGNWTWDGLDDKNNILPIGTYIIFIELFNLQGKKNQFKKTVVLARPLK